MIQILVGIAGWRHNSLVLSHYHYTGDMLAGIGVIVDRYFIRSIKDRLHESQKSKAFPPARIFRSAAATVILFLWALGDFPGKAHAVEKLPP